MLEHAGRNRQGAHAPRAGEDAHDVGRSRGGGAVSVDEPRIEEPDGCGGERRAVRAGRAHRRGARGVPRAPGVVRGVPRGGRRAAGGRRGAARRGAAAERAARAQAAPDGERPRGRAQARGRRRSRGAAEARSDRARARRFGCAGGRTLAVAALAAAVVALAVVALSSGSGGGAGSATRVIRAQVLPSRASASLRVERRARAAEHRRHAAGAAGPRVRGVGQTLRVGRPQPTDALFTVSARRRCDGRRARRRQRRTRSDGHLRAARRQPRADAAGADRRAREQRTGSAPGRSGARVLTRRPRAVWRRAGRGGPG